VVDDQVARDLVDPPFRFVPFLAAQAAVDPEEDLLQDIFRLRFIRDPPADERQKPAAVPLPERFQFLILH
jgi:hypothetical protein